MKLYALVLAALALLAGFAGGSTAFSSAASPVPTPAPVHLPHRPAPHVVRPAPVVRWAPCHRPAVLEGHTCVTHVVHTVTMPSPPSPPSPAAPQPVAASAPAPYQPVTAAPTSARHAGPPTHDGGRDGGGGDGGHDD